MRTSDNASLSSGSFRSSYLISIPHPHKHTDLTYPSDQIGCLWRNGTGYLQVDIPNTLIRGYQVSAYSLNGIDAYLHGHSYPRMVDCRRGTRMSRRPMPRDRPLMYAPFLRPFLGAGSREYRIASYAYHLEHATSVNTSAQTTTAKGLTTLHPKSPIFSSPFNPPQSASAPVQRSLHSPIKMFSGLMSRCMTCFLWRYDKASAI